MNEPIFKSAEIVGENYDSRLYHKIVEPRGSLAFPMSRSELKEFSKCPSKWKRGSQSKDSDATEWGTLMDCLVTDAGRFKERFAVRPATYTDKDGAQKKWTNAANVCKKWTEDNAGFEIVTQPDLDEANIAIQRLKEDADIWDIITKARKQVYIKAVYEDAETGLSIPVKTLIDLLPEKWAGDFKTAADASPRGWPMIVNKYGYDMQAAMVIDLLESAGEPRPEFRHIIQENTAPYEIGTRWITSEFIAIGRKAYLDALARYAQCLKTNIWPSYDPTGNTVIDGRWSACAPTLFMLQNYEQS